MAKPYLISRPTPGSLVLTRSRRHSAWSLASISGFFAVWYIFQIAFHKGWANLVDKVVSGDWMTILFVAAPLLSLKELVHAFGNVVNPRVISFDSDTRRILDGNQVVGTYDEVTQVLIKTLKDSDGHEEHALMVRMGANAKLRIEQGKDYAAIFELADEVAEVLKLAVEKTKG